MVSKLDNLNKEASSFLKKMQKRLTKDLSIELLKKLTVSPKKYFLQQIVDKNLTQKDFDGILKEIINDKKDKPIDVIAILGINNTEKTVCCVIGILNGRELSAKEVAEKVATGIPKSISNGSAKNSFIKTSIEKLENLVDNINLVLNNIK